MTRLRPRGRAAGGRRAGVALLGVVVLAGCSGGGAKPSTPSRVVTATSTPPATTIAPASGAPIPPTAPVTETDGTCPYIATQAAADAEGNRIGRVTTVSTTPVGCNFYFQYADKHRTLEISVVNYASADDAYNGMVATGRAGGDFECPGLVPGVDAVLFRTAFYANDGDRDWACVFAKGPNVVTVKTDQNDTSFNARNIATMVAPKF